MSLKPCLSGISECITNLGPPFHYMLRLSSDFKLLVTVVKLMLSILSLHMQGRGLLTLWSIGLQEFPSGKANNILRHFFRVIIHLFALRRKSMETRIVSQSFGNICQMLLQALGSPAKPLLAETAIQQKISGVFFVGELAGHVVWQS